MTRPAARCGALLPTVNFNGTMKQSDPPLVRPIGAKLSPEAMRFIARVAALFPGSERDIIIIRQKPITASTREPAIGITHAREGKENGKP